MSFSARVLQLGVVAATFATVALAAPRVADA